ncbi:MAG: transposase [Nitrospira sp.]|nr:transposase [Nitrospira sp.]
MGLDETSETTIMRVQVDQPGEACMVDQERWAEIRRLFDEERVSISEIGRRLDLDRKDRTPQSATADLAPIPAGGGRGDPPDRPCRLCADPRPTGRVLGADSVSGAAGKPRLYRQLRDREAVWPPLRGQGHADRALLRFETPPGQQSQIDWGQALVSFRAGPQVVHVFVLTLGFSRRGFYYACADERLAQFLESHERAFAHFSGHHTRASL